MEKTQAAVAMVGLQTIVRREFHRIMRIWPQTLMPSVVTTLLYFIIFGSLVGGRIGPMQGIDYIAYIAPGLIMMAIITNSYGNVVSSFFGANFGKYVEELLVAPLPNWVIVSGYVCGGLVRGIIVGALVTVVALVFTSTGQQALHVYNLPVVLASMLLTSAVFSLGGFINAVFARDFDQVNWIPAFVLTPLTYLGGVFYSVDVLPAWAQKVSLANPILHMVSAFRYGFLGISDVGIGKAFTIMVVCVVALFAWATALLNRGTGTRD
jgi:ABC-2 type transport system permease protein